MVNKKEFYEISNLLADKAYNLNLVHTDKWKEPGYCGHTVIRNVFNNFLKNKGLDFGKISKFLTDEKEFPIIRTIRETLIKKKNFPDNNPLNEDFSLALLLILLKNDNDYFMQFVTTDGWLTGTLILILFHNFGFKNLDLKKEVPDNSEDIAELMEKEPDISKYVILINKGKKYWIILKRVIKGPGGELKFECYDPDDSKPEISPYIYKDDDQLYFLVFGNVPKHFDSMLSKKFNKDINQEYIDFLIKEFGDDAKYYVKLDNISNFYTNYRVISNFWNKVETGEFPYCICYNYDVIKGENKIINSLLINFDNNLKIRSENKIDLMLILKNKRSNNEIKDIIKKEISLKPDGNYYSSFLYEDEIMDEKNLAMNGEVRTFSIIKKNQDVKFIEQKIYSLIKTPIASNDKSKEIFTKVKYLDSAKINYLPELIALSHKLELSLITEVAQEVISYQNDFGKLLSNDLSYFDPLNEYFKILTEILTRIKVYAAEKLNLESIENYDRSINIIKIYDYILNAFEKNKNAYIITPIPKLLGEISDLIKTNWVPKFFDVSALIFEKLLLHINAAEKEIFNSKTIKEASFLGDLNKISRFEKFKKFFKKIKNRQNTYDISKEWLGENVKESLIDVDYFMQEDYGELVEIKLAKCIEFLLTLINPLKINDFKKESQYLINHPNFYKEFFELVRFNIFGSEDEWVKLSKLKEQKFGTINIYENLEFIFNLIKKFSDGNQEKLLLIEYLIGKLPKNLNRLKNDLSKSVIFNPETSLKENEKDPFIISVLKVHEIKEDVDKAKNKGDTEIIKKKIIDRAKIKKALSHQVKPIFEQFNYYADDWGDDGEDDFEVWDNNLESIKNLRWLMNDMGFSDNFFDVEKGPYSKSRDEVLNKFKNALKNEDKKILCDKLIQIIIYFSRKMSKYVSDKLKSYIRIMRGCVVLFKKGKKSDDEIKSSRLGRSMKFEKQDLEKIEKTMDLLIDYMNTPLVTPSDATDEFLKIYNAEKVLDSIPYDDKYEFFVRWVIYWIWMCANFHDEKYVLFFSLNKKNKEKYAMEYEELKDELKNIVKKVEETVDKIKK